MPLQLFCSPNRPKLGCGLLLLLFFAASPLTVFGAPPAGMVIGWGDNVSGQATGIPGQLIGVVMIAGQALTNATAVAAGMNHSLAIREDGTVVDWGNNGRGQATGAPSEYPGRAAGVVKIEGQILTGC
ncbi:MAG: hypothetical protein KJ070_25765 [Verrucomicrobia bacterium]|nr:hypothetical protein [Verrucomicrobiota bacterium]